MQLTGVAEAVASAQQASANARITRNFMFPSLATDYAGNRNCTLTTKVADSSIYLNSRYLQEGRDNVVGRYRKALRIRLDWNWTIGQSRVDTPVTLAYYCRAKSNNLAPPARSRQPSHPSPGIRLTFPKTVIA